MLLSLALVLGLKDPLRTICKSLALALALALRVQALALALALRGLGLGLDRLPGLGLGSPASHLVTSFTSPAFVQLVYVLLLPPIEKMPWYFHSIPWYQHGVYILWYAMLQTHYYTRYTMV